MNTEYSKLSQKAENILFMLKFLNYAYNQPDSDHDLPMTNEEKTGGQLVFFNVMDELKSLDKELNEFVKNGVCYER